MLTVLHVLNTGSYSGAENVVITIIRHFDKSKYRLIYVSLEGSIRKVLEENRIEYEPITSMCRAEIKRVIKKYNPDIIHAHDFTAGVICSLSTKKNIINHLHNNSPWIKKISCKSLLYFISSLRFKKILTVSSSIMNEYVFGWVLKNKTVTIGNPIDIGRIRECAVVTNKKYDVAFLGRLSYPKNPMGFLDIISIIKEKISTIHAVIIGDGEMRTEIEERIIKDNLNECIELVGFQNNPYTYLSVSKILCMPSKWEGFGLAAVEALALGKPVIASNVGGLPDIVTSECGKLCVDKYEFAKEIINLLEDPVRYSKFSTFAKMRADKLANLDEFIKNISYLYCEISNKQ